MKIENKIDSLCLKKGSFKMAQKIDFEALKTISPSEIKPLQVLDENGKVIDPNFFPDLSDEQIVELFKQMLWSRVLDERSTKLNRQGRLGFLLQLLGKKLRRSRLNLRWKRQISYYLLIVMFRN